MKYYILTDHNEKVNLIGAIRNYSTSDKRIVDNNLKICQCGFSWDSKEQANDRLNSFHCIVIAGRPIDEDEGQILQSAWVTAGKKYYKDHFDMPREVGELDIQFNCVAEEIE